MVASTLLESLPAECMELLTDAQRSLFDAGGCLADYDVLKPIGKGKFSVVFKAQRRKDAVAVALKKIAIFDLMDARAREKTLKEVRLVQSVNHENIVQYLDAFLDGKELYIAFEWADAGDLKRQIRKANERGVRFDERTIWRYFSQLCAAILHLHRARIMHRDLKPANILLTTHGVVKVGDLGLGRHLSENTLEAHSKVGTPLYMSPEVLKGEGYDWKSDVWSLGCILYELAMLRSPFKSEGLNLYGLFQKINKGDYEPIPDIYSSHLRALVTQMISLDAARRPTMEQVWEACQTRPATAELNQGEPRKPKTMKTADPGRNDVDARNSERTATPTTPTFPSSSRPSSQQSNLPASTSRPTSSNGLPHQPQTQLGGVTEDELIKRHEDMAMELLYDRLTLLPCHLASDIELQRSLTRHHFATESRSVPTWTRSPHERFRELVRVARWLLRLMGNCELVVDQHVDMQPPAVQAQMVLLAAGHAGVDVAQLSAGSLTTGCGLPVCLLLTAMSEKALAATRDTRRRPVYPKEAVDDVGGESTWEVQSTDNDEATLSGDETTSTALENDDTFGWKDPRWLIVSGTNEREPGDGEVMIQSRVDAGAWRREVERMQGRLEGRWKECRARAWDDAWRARFESLTQLSASVGRVSGVTCETVRRSSEVCQQDNKQVAALEARALAQVRTAEQRHRDASTRLECALAALATRQAAVASLTQSLDGVTRAAQSAAQTLGREQARVGDATPLARIKTQLRRLREESVELQRRAEVARALGWRIGRGFSQS